MTSKLPGSVRPVTEKPVPVRRGQLDLSSRRLIADAHAQGMRVLYWTVNEADVARELFARGADGIITDWPGRMREFATP